jgi:ribosomal protein S4
MRYPGYLLNPGDMFQVEPDLVLYATGAKKSVSTERKASRIARGKTEKSTKASIEAEASSTIEDEPVESESQKEEEDQTHSDQEPSTSKSTKKSDPSASPSALLEIARAFQLSRSSILTIEDRFEQRRAQKHLHNIIARSSIPTDDLQSVDAQLAELTSQLTLHAPKMLSFTQQPSSNENHTPTMSAGDRNALKKILQAIKDNPADDTKTYGTPWRPRDYMSAFTFIPRFLEVNQKICAAVYLRHPVARPGSAEVPSPYGFDSQQLAFNWYLRRR